MTDLTVKIRRYRESDNDSVWELHHLALEPTGAMLPGGQWNDNDLNDIEKEYLAFAPRLITYTIAVRFLTDYIDGDNYFKIHHEHHNLQRARAQLKLVKSMEEQYEKMQGIIRKLI